MASAAQLLAIAAKEVGTTEVGFTNRVKYSTWYGYPAAWCNMFVDWCLVQAGMDPPGKSATAPKGSAYTPSSAAYYQHLGAWRSKSKTYQPGDVVFFDFPGDGVNRISHVGFVVKDLGNGYIDTIEGNTSNGSGGSQRDGGGVWRRRRAKSLTVGCGIPAYDSGAPAGTRLPNAPYPYPGSRQLGDTGQGVKYIQALLRDHAGYKLDVDGDFGPATKTAVVDFQKKHDLGGGGGVGPKTWHFLQYTCVFKTHDHTA
jgi:hypothetical protein